MRGRMLPAVLDDSVKDRENKRVAIAAEARRRNNEAEKNRKHFSVLNMGTIEFPIPPLVWPHIINGRVPIASYIVIGMSDEFRGL